MENEKNSVQQEAVVPAKKKSKKKWIVIAVVAVVLILALGSSGSDSSNDPVVNSGADVSNSETVSDSEETTKPSTSEIKVGSSVTEDGVTIIYKSCDSDFKNYSQYADIKDGYKVIQAVFDFENNSDTDTSLNGFECYADGVKCEEFYSVDDYSSPILESVSAGRKLLDAKVYYEVPANAETIELEYQYDYWNGDKFIFIVE